MSKGETLTEVYCLNKDKERTYEIVCRSKMKIDKIWQDVVIYKCLYENPDGDTWVRPVEDFEENFSLSHKHHKQDHKELTLNEYQRRAMTTCMESSHNYTYMFNNLIGEIGEFSSKIAKQIRKREAFVQNNDLVGINSIDKPLIIEIGDVMWQLFGLIDVLGWAAEDIARMNLQKLAKRKSDGVIDGDGDNR